MSGENKLIAGTANPELAQEISDSIGVPLCKCVIKSFADGALQPLSPRRTGLSFLLLLRLLAGAALTVFVCRRGVRPDRREHKRREKERGDRQRHFRLAKF